MPTVSCDPLDAKIMEEYARLCNKQAVANKLGITRDRVRRCVKRNRPWTAAPEAETQKTSVIREDDNGNATIDLHTNEPVKTLEDAIRVANVDTLVWYVERYEVSNWTVPMKLGTPTGHRPIQTQQYRIKVFLKRIVKRSLGVALEAIYERMAKHAPRYQKPVINKVNKSEPLLAVFALFDSHYGKLCWSPEVGNDYDLKIAEQLFRNAVVDLVEECKHKNIDRVLLPIGNDFFNIDSKSLTTFRGTPQDTDGRYTKIYEAGLMSTIWAVESLAAIAEVDVVWVPGNHDPTISYHLAKTVEAWFRNNHMVKVDASPKSRKYFSFGCNLIGLTHGDSPKPEDLPSLMATEQPVRWAESTCREVLIGHQHRSRSWVTKGTDTHRGVTVRVLKSLSGTDEFHFKNGYVGCQQAAEVYWYSKSNGYCGHAVVNARTK